MQIKRIFHAGFVFSSDSTRIIFDPILEVPFSFNCFPFPEANFELEQISRDRFDAIFISHIHDDHFSLKSLALFDKNIPVYIFSLSEEAVAILKALGFSQVQSLQLNTTYVIGDLKIATLPALDTDVDCIFHIYNDAVSVLHLVDSWIDWQVLERFKKTCPKLDLLLWPYQTMREYDALAPNIAAKADEEVPVEWLEQIEYLQPNFVIPSACQFKFEEWSYLNSFFFPISYKKFIQTIEDLGMKSLRLDPGEVISISAITENGLEKIIQSNGNTLFNDYCYDPLLKIPTMTEISQYFVSLDVKQKHRVDLFLNCELCDLYNELQFKDEFFEKKVNWLLEVVKDGHIEAHFYKISDGKMKRCESRLVDHGVFDWKTEIIEAKLWSALEQAESLSSLYVRVNDIASESYQNKIKEVDPLQDPLLRVLYRETQFTYQKHQLKELGFFDKL